MTDWNKWRGLVALTSDVVDHGSRAVEKIHMETAARPFVILEQIPGVDAPAKVVHAVHDLWVGAVYGQVRLWNRLTRKVLETTLPAQQTPEPPPDPAD